MQIRMASATDAAIVAQMIKRLTDEIIENTEAQHFNIDLAATANRACQFLERGIYTVFLAIDHDREIAFAALCESYALYAEGKFGIIQEFYVDQRYRSQGVGREMLDRIKQYGKQREWTRLELCTPPLPAFDRSLNFYQNNGFEITGGRKMKYIL